MKLLVAQHRSVWQESILQFPLRCVPFAGAWRVRFQVPRPGCDLPIELAASDRKTGLGLRHFAAGLHLFRLVPTQGSRQNGPLA